MPALTDHLKAIAMVLCVWIVSTNASAHPAEYNHQHGATGWLLLSFETVGLGLAFYCLAQARKLLKTRDYHNKETPNDL